MARLLGRLGQAACALALATAALAACGDDAGDGAGLASLAPPDAPLYVEAVIRPEGDQAAAVESFAQRVGGVSDPGAAIVAQLDAGLASEGLDATYADDIEPWLGAHAAAFVSSFEPTNPTDTSPDFAVLVQVEDADAAREFLQRVADQDPAPQEERSYEGTDYLATPDGVAAGVVDDTAMVLGTENAFQVAVDSSQGESLEESPEYADRAGALPDDALASAFLVPAATIEAVLASDGIDPGQAEMWTPVLDGLLSDPVATTVTATPDAVSVDLAAMLDSNVLLSTDPALLEALPRDSWLAIAIPELGQALEHALDQLSSSGLPGAGQLESHVRERTGLELGEIFGWLGDAAAFLDGTRRGTISAGVVAETTDPAASRELLAALERIAGVQADVVGDAIVAARGTTVDAVLGPEQALGEAPGFREAAEGLGEDFPPGFYLDLPSLFTVAEQGSDGDIDYDAIHPYTRAFASLIAGSRVDESLVLSRFTVRLAGE